MRRILLLLLLARRGWTSRVGLRSSLKRKSESVHELGHIHALKFSACEDEHIRQSLVEDVQDSDCKAKGYKEQGYKEQDCTARGCKVPVAAAVRTRVVQREEVACSRLVAVVARIAAVVRIVVAGRMAAAVRTAAAVVVQATGSLQHKERETECSAGGAVGAARDMVSFAPAAVAAVVAPAERQHHRQQDVLQEACRCRVKSAVVAVGFRSVAKREVRVGVVV